MKKKRPIQLENEGEMKKGGWWIERGDEGWRDMAHLLLLSGCCEIAGFPRSANCGSEFFLCLSPLTPSLPPPLSCTFSLSLIFSVPHVPSLSLSNGLYSYFLSNAVVMSDNTLLSSVYGTCRSFYVYIPLQYSLFLELNAFWKSKHGQMRKGLNNIQICCTVWPLWSLHVERRGKALITFSQNFLLFGFEMGPRDHP